MIPYNLKQGSISLLKGVIVIKLKWLENLRGELTHQKVAERAEINRAYYTQIENGTRTPGVNVAKRIANTLGFDWTIFYDEEGNETMPRDQLTGTE